MTASRIFLWVTLLSLAGFVAAIVIEFWSPWYLGSYFQIMPSIAFVLLFSVISFGCAVAMERGRAMLMMRIGIYTAMAAMLGFQLWVWMPNPDLEIFWPKLVVWPTAFCSFAVVIGLLLLPSMNDVTWRVVSGVSIFLLASFALSITLAVFLYPDWWLGEYFIDDKKNWNRGMSGYEYEQQALKVCGTIGSMAIGGMIVTFLGAWLLSLAGRMERTAVKHAYWMGCPRCGTGQDVSTGLAMCSRCGLKVKTEVL